MGKEDKEYTWNLIAKKLSGEASPEELRELESLLRNNPELHYPLQTITDLWKGKGRTASNREAEMAFNRHLDRMKELKIDYAPAMVPLAVPAKLLFPVPFLSSEKTRYRGRFLLLATGVSVAIWFTIWLLYPGVHSTSAAGRPVAALNQPSHDILTAPGLRTNLTLPDGTQVWLNAGSHLSYDKSFGSTSREVTLTGEAFFDVAKNADLPFLIHTARIDIKVLGTRFNVKSYPSDKTTEATLVRGSIEVSIKDRPSEKIILKPNEKLVVANDDSALHRSINPMKSNAGADESLVTIKKPTYEENTGQIIETAWVDNRLTFREEKFSDLSRRMERWYGVTIHFADPALEKLKFTGVFRQESVQQALDALQLTAKFSYAIVNTEILIDKK